MENGAVIVAHEPAAGLLESLVVPRHATFWHWAYLANRDGRRRQTESVGMKPICRYIECLVGTQCAFQDYIIVSQGGV